MPEPHAGSSTANLRSHSRLRERRFYTALDNPKDTKRFLAGLGRLTKRGVRPHHIYVYMLIGYWPGEDPGEREARLRTIREFGAKPYPMPYLEMASRKGPLWPREKGQLLSCRGHRAVAGRSVATGGHGAMSAIAVSPPLAPGMPDCVWRP